MHGTNGGPDGKADETNGGPDGKADEKGDVDEEEDETRARTEKTH